MNTVLITGCSSGFGRDIASYFLDRGWKVVATMRTPDASVLPASENLRILPLDVRSDDSVRQAVEAAGPIDVLVNNAGIGWLNALEGTPMDIAKNENSHTGKFLARFYNEEAEPTLPGKKSSKRA